MRLLWEKLILWDSKAFRDYLVTAYAILAVAKKDKVPRVHKVKAPESQPPGLSSVRCGYH